MRDLVVLLGSLQTDQEREKFLSIFLSPAEVGKVSQRWVAIRLLLEGYRQRAAQAETKMGIATVSRAARQITQEREFLELLQQRCRPK